MGADLLHPGHLNIINTATKYGEVIIGLLTDSAVVKFSRLPYMTYEQRKIIMESVKGVREVVMQDTLDYTKNLEKIKPDYVVHGDDWKIGIQADIRKKVIETIRQWGGALIEVPYTQGISSTLINNAMREIGVTPEIRSARLHRLINAKDIVRVMEAHNGLSGLIVEQTSINHNGYDEEFDALWISSLTQSSAKAKPDNGFLDASTRISALSEILDVTTKPIIYDGDSGELATNYYELYKEWHYRDIEARVFGEELLSQSGADPTTYKFHIFGKNHTQNFIQVTTERFSENYQRAIMDYSWKPTPFGLAYDNTKLKHTPPRPATLESMINLAHILAEPFAYVRVDLYNADSAQKDCAFVGELTFTPMGGTDKFVPIEYDKKFGDLWNIKDLQC